MRSLLSSLVLLPFLASTQVTTGPCDNTLGGPCESVRVATTCFASIGMGANQNQNSTLVYRCVDDQNSTVAKQAVRPLSWMECVCRVREAKDWHRYVLATDAIRRLRNGFWRIKLGKWYGELVELHEADESS